MGNKTGVWIDSKKAIVVELADNDKKVRTIESGFDSRERKEGEGKKFGRFAGQFLNFEKRKQRKQLKQEKSYFEKVLKILSRSEEVVLFGPAGTKVKLQKEIESRKNLPFNLKGVEDADSMTDNQVAAWVNDYFKS